MSIEAMKLAAEFNRYFTSANGVDVPAKVSVSRDEWRALFTAIQQAEAKTHKSAAVRNPFAARCYTMSESHLSGHRLIVGFEKLGDAQDAHEWVARQGRGDFTHQAPSVPDGYALVPIEPTQEMLLAYTGGAVTNAGFRWCRHQWSAMLAAAPAAHPAPSVPDDMARDAERGRFLVGWLKRFGLLQAEFGQIGAGEKSENWWLLNAPWGIDKTRPFFGHGKTPEQAIDAAMLAAKDSK